MAVVKPSAARRRQKGRKKRRQNCGRAPCGLLAAAGVTDAIKGKKPRSDRKKEGGAGGKRPRKTLRRKAQPLRRGGAAAAERRPQAEVRARLGAMPRPPAARRAHAGGKRGVGREPHEEACDRYDAVIWCRIKILNFLFKIIYFYTRGNGRKTPPTNGVWGGSPTRQRAPPRSGGAPADTSEGVDGVRGGSPARRR